MIRRSKDPPPDPEPGQSVVGSSIGGHNIQIGSTTGDVVVLLDRHDYRLEFLVPIAVTSRRVPRSQRQPSYLLDPQRQIVPYRDRVAEQRRLTEWRDYPDEPVSVVLLHGAGGQGKTRLASQFASHSHQAGWAVAQAVERNPRLRSGNDQSPVLADGQALLVVVDYAERWRRAILAEMVDSLPLDYPGRRIRVLLLARPGQGVWEALAAELDRGVVDLAEPIELGAFIHDARDYAAAFAEAARAFAERMQVDMPPLPLQTGHVGSNYASPLIVHMAALATVCAASQDQVVPQRDVSGFLLSHERRYWNVMSVDGCGAPAELIEQLVFLATLLGPVAGLAAACGLLQRARLADGEAQAAQLIAAHERLYPPSRPQSLLSRESGESSDLPGAETLQPLRPDRFGEDFVGQYLTYHPHAGQLLVELLAEQDSNVLVVRRCLVVLAAAATRHRAAETTLFTILRRLSNLGSALLAEFERTGDPADLDRAVEVGQIAAAALADHPDRTAYLADLGDALRLRFESTGDLADVDRAVAVCLEAVAGTPSNHSRLAAVLPKLGSALMARFLRTGQLADLDHMINIARQALVAAPPGHPDRAMHLTRFGTTLATRFESTGQFSDLDQAVHVMSEAVAVTPDGPERALHLSNLGNALRMRSECTGDLSDLVRAVEVGLEAVASTPNDSPRRPAMLSNLGNAFRVRFERTGNSADLDDAVRMGIDAAETTPPNRPERARYLSDLGNALALRFERTGNFHELDDAVQCARAAVNATPPDHPEMAQYLLSLGNALATQFSRAGDLHMTEEAIEVWRRAADSRTSAVLVRIRAAWRWAQMADRLAPGGPLALQGYTVAVKLLSVLAWHGLSRSDRERLLLDWAGLAGEAAACAITAGDLQLALRLVEQGRAVLWTQQLEAHADLADLAQREPALAARLYELRAELDQPYQPDDLARIDGSTTIDRRMRRAREWDDLVTHVRSVDGFEYFMRPLPDHALYAAASDGPIVVINMSSRRCDALILTPSGVQAIPLPKLTLDQANEKAKVFIGALAENIAHPDPEQTFEQVATATLEWLWDTIAEPILDLLGYAHRHQVPEPWPRLWWCPTGPLTLLPLHAAGYHNPEDRSSGRTALDRVISSYTPTIGSLARARSGATPQSQEANRPPLLIVGASQGLGQFHSSGINKEIELLHNIFPESLILADSVATWQAVSAALPRFPWVHFACHSIQDPVNPSEGGLVLYDRLLTISEIAALDMRHGELAFLSADSTATPGTTLPDECISMASALHYAGYRNVIATLWGILDESAVKFTKNFYGLLVERTGLGTLDAALALHYAVHALRARYPFVSLSWMPYVHIGPGGGIRRARPEVPSPVGG